MGKVTAREILAGQSSTMIDLIKMGIPRRMTESMHG